MRGKYTRENVYVQPRCSEKVSWKELHLSYTLTDKRDFTEKQLLFSGHYEQVYFLNRDENSYLNILFDRIVTNCMWTLDT